MLPRRRFDLFGAEVAQVAVATRPLIAAVVCFSSLP